MPSVELFVLLLSITAIMEIVSLIIKKTKQAPVDKNDRIKGIISLIYLIGVGLISVL